jgi:phosphate transport system substrate-binding protein
MARIKILGLLLFFAACGSNQSSEKLDTTTSGEITIACDESLQPIIEAEEAVFESLYPEAKINVVYLSEYDAIQYLLADSARLAIVTRDLNTTEKEALKAQKNITSHFHKLGYDAVGFILNPANTDTSFSLEQIRKLLSGEITQWNQVSASNKLGNIQVVFDHARSGAVRLLEDSVLKGSKLGKNCFALKSNPEVLDYVEKNKNAIGIIGVSWISDLDDKQSKYFLDKVKVAEVQPILMRVAGITNKPIQGNIALKQYPYWRPILAVSRELRAGLGTGFASFMESEPGQKIILKGGLVPQRSSIRTINLSE